MSVRGRQGADADHDPAICAEHAAGNFGRHGEGGYRRVRFTSTVHLVSYTDYGVRLYKGLYPLWGRQIPYTMMKFASFETTVELIYTALPGKKDDYGSAAQTAVAFTGGYIAGILCAVVSHPADVMVSKLNANRQPGEAFGAAMRRIYGDIGFKGLWNGLFVRIIMIGTLTGLQWMMYVSLPSQLFRMVTDLMAVMIRQRSSWVCRRPEGLRRIRPSRKSLVFAFSFSALRVFALFGLELNPSTIDIAEQ